MPSNKTVTFDRSRKRKDNCGSVTIPKNEIIYIETYRKLKLTYIICATGETYSAADYSKREILSILNDSRFVVCQRSYIVNMDFISTLVLDNCVALKTGDYLRLGDKYRDILKYIYQSRVVGGASND